MHANGSPGGLYGDRGVLLFSPSPGRPSLHNFVEISSPKPVSAGRALDIPKTSLHVSAVKEMMASASPTPRATSAHFCRGGSGAVDVPLRPWAPSTATSVRSSSSAVSRSNTHRSSLHRCGTQTSVGPAHDDPHAMAEASLKRNCGVAMVSTTPRDHRGPIILTSRGRPLQSVDPTVGGGSTVVVPDMAKDGIQTNPGHSMWSRTSRFQERQRPTPQSAVDSRPPGMVQEASSKANSGVAFKFTSGRSGDKGPPTMHLKGLHRSSPQWLSENVKLRQKLEALRKLLKDLAQRLTNAREMTVRQFVLECEFKEDRLDTGLRMFGYGEADRKMLVPHLIESHAAPQSARACSPQPRPTTPRSSVT
jgi:hypothetical protein